MVRLRYQPCVQPSKIDGQAAVIWVDGKDFVRRGTNLCDSVLVQRLGRGDAVE
jgi:hypothetical protein